MPTFNENIIQFLRDLANATTGTLNEDAILAALAVTSNTGMTPGEARKMIEDLIPGVNYNDYFRSAVKSIPGHIESWDANIGVTINA